MSFSSSDKDESKIGMQNIFRVMYPTCGLSSRQRNYIGEGD